MTGALGRSALVAALFAVHPLHVESVAWISERKDVLSTCFFMLTIWAYYRYVQSRQDAVQSPMSNVQSQGTRSTLHAPRFYVLSLSFFALGLMSKPMLVTLPFVLLLLDYWPLRRNAECGMRSANSGVQSAEAGAEGRTLPWMKLVLEKVPFFVLAIISSVITYCVQKQGGTMDLLEHIPLGNRLGNAFIAYLRYIGKMIWPSHLAVLYPHPMAWPVWQVAVAAVVLLGLSWAAIRLARRHPYVAVGWFWYLGTLVPVIGLIQVGEQTLADRYTYIPMIGLFIVLAWGVWEIAASWPERDFRLGSVAVLVVMVLAVGTRIQLQYWRTGRVLLEHSLKAGGGSGVIHGNLGVILMDEGNLAEAQRHFEAALRCQPNYVRARVNLAVALVRQDKDTEALRVVRDMEARHMEPDWEAQARWQMGQSFLDRMKVSEAIEQFLAAAKLAPTNAPIRGRLDR